MQEAKMSSFGKCDEKFISQPRPPCHLIKLLPFFSLRTALPLSFSITSIRLCPWSNVLEELASHWSGILWIDRLSSRTWKTVPTAQQIIIKIQSTADPISVEIPGSANYLHCIRHFVSV